MNSSPVAGSVGNNPTDTHHADRALFAAEAAQAQDKQRIAPAPANAAASGDLPPLRTPSEQQRYNRNLYLEVAWYGLLAGSTLGFIVIYITRLGAFPWQIGWMNAGPALISLLITLPVGRWLSTQHVGAAILRMTMIHRSMFALFIVIPFILPPAEQIWAYIILTLVMTIPGTALAIGFNALYAAAVPPELRGQVAGIRNALLALTLVISSLLSGFILDRMPLQTGYAIVFSMGFVGALMSAVHLWKLRDLRGDEGVDPSTIRSPLGDNSRATGTRADGSSVRGGVALRLFARGRVILRPEILRTSFGPVVLALMFFHFAQYIPAPLFPIFWVEDLNFTDQQISLGTAIFQFCVFLGSFQIGWLTRRKGNLWITVTGIIALGLYPITIAAANGMTLYLVASLLGGFAWSMVGSSLANYLLDIAPPGDRPAYLAWYNIALSAGILLGSLAGPIFADLMGLRVALVAAGVLRAAAGVAVWLAGRRARRYPIIVEAPAG